jgi:hypothetical protein
MQDSEDKETSADEVQTEYKRIKIILLGGEIFRTRPDRPLGPLCLLHNGYRVSFRGVKRPGRGVNHPHQAPRLKKEYSYTSLLPLRALTTCSRVNFIFTIY